MRERWLKTTACCGLLLGSPGLSLTAPAAADTPDTVAPAVPATADPAAATAAAPATPGAATRAGPLAPIPEVPPPVAPPPPLIPVSPKVEIAPPGEVGPTPSADKLHWLDRTRQEVYDSVWHSSMRVDRWFGSDRDEYYYQHNAYGSAAPALLYDQYDHFRPIFRFQANFPLPQIDERFHAFIGRVNPEEYISERDEPSGAFQRQYGPATEDETIFGLSFHQPPRQSGYFDFGAGVRLGLPMDPYAKVSFVFERGASERGLFSFREILYWQNSDGGLGETTRLDLERIYDMRWLVRYTISGTVAQKTQGTRGYTALLAMRGFPNRHAIAVEVGMDGETKGTVPLHDYGVKVAYRQSVLRRWLIMEVRASVDWPKDFTYQHRSSSLGVGIGFEMLFGTEEFLARPVTF